MHHISFAPVAAGLLLMTATAVSQPANEKQKEAPDIGAREYNTNCAVCHGLQGRGDGPYADHLTIRMPDITLLSQKNGGVFPFQRVYNVIDGTEMLRGHGTRQMPIWGQLYSFRAEEDYFSWRAFPWDAQGFVRARILALTDFIARLQVKAENQL
jgi:mono/diheme cytochrome c family protein